MFISFKYLVASDSPLPPDKNIIPPTAGRIERDSVRTVYQATVLGSALSLQSAPDVIIEGFNRLPSSRTPNCRSFCVTLENTFSATSAHFSIEWSPSWSISGSTIGQSPFSWQIAAYLANVCAVSSIAASLGYTSEILITDLHFANRHPIS